MEFKKFVCFSLLVVFSLSLSLAWAQAPLNISIPAQSLGSALNTLARQIGVRILFDASLTDGHTAPEIQGAFMPQQALNKLLAGSGLSATAESDGDYVIRSGSTPELPEVKVTEQPIIDEDYIATQSTTGTKTDTPIIETPQSISVVTQQQIEIQQPQSLPQALGYTPGIAAVVPVTADTNLPSYLLLRGFQPFVFLDGLTTFTSQIPGGLTLTDPYLISRIDVLSGPASVLYGQASPGGLINMESKLPTATPFHEVFAGIGNYDRYEAGFDLSGPLDQGGQFLYRLTGIGSDQHTQIDFVKQDSIAIAPAFTYKPDDNTTFTLLAKFIDQPNLPDFNTDLPAQGTLLPNPYGKIPTNLFVGDPNYSTSRQKVVSLGYLFEHRFSDVWTMRSRFNYVYDTNFDKALEDSTLDNDLRTIERYQFTDSQTNNFIEFDNQAEAKFSTGPIHHTVLMGIDIQHETTMNQSVYNPNGPSLDLFAPIYGLTIPDLAPTDVGRSNMDQIAPYFQDQLAIGHWRVLAGVRGDWASQNFVDIPSGSSTIQFPYASDDLAPSYRAGAVYLFDIGLAPYASYTTSFTPNAGFNVEGQPFVPTTAKQYEGGIKYQPPGWNSFITAAAYNLTEENVLIPDPVNNGFEIQSGEITVNGGEFSAHANLTNNLNLIASYTVTKAVNTKSTVTDTTLTGITESIQGKVPEQTPKKIASLWADYTIPAALAHGLGVGGGVRYIGGSYGDDVNDFIVPSYTIFDAVLQYDLGLANPILKGFKAQVNVNNLMDKDYVASCRDEIGCFYGARRTIYGTLKYDW